MRSKIITGAVSILFSIGTLLLFTSGSFKGDPSLVDKYYYDNVKSYPEVIKMNERLDAVSAKASEYRNKLSRFEGISQEYFNDAVKYLARIKNAELRTAMEKKLRESSSAFENKNKLLKGQRAAIDSLLSREQDANIAVKLAISMKEQGKITHSMKTDDQEYKDLLKEMKAAIEELEGFAKK